MLPVSRPSRQTVFGSDGVSSRIMIKNIPEGMTREELELYFANKKIANIEYEGKGVEAFITYENSSGIYIFFDI